VGPRRHLDAADARGERRADLRRGPRRGRASTGHTGPLPPVDLLVISGGGDNGAFGAGLLCAWSTSGTRPTFKSVTGISTGALIAPIAFVGSECDGLLRKIYTSVTPADILDRRNILAALTNDGMADNRPLWELISRSFDAMTALLLTVVLVEQILESLPGM
jgi:hypothetical protein